jgi:hypothetical protein
MQSSNPETIIISDGTPDTSYHRQNRENFNPHKVIVSREPALLDD